MAMIKGGKKLLEKNYLSSPNGTKNIPVEIVSPVFIDPENKRLVSYSYISKWFRYKKKNFRKF